MKALILSLALLTSLPALASTTLILDLVNSRWSYDGVSYRINEELGRAWLEVNLSDSGSENTSYRTERVKLEGLRYDAGSQQIVLEQNGELVVCADVRELPRRVFNRVGIYPTGRCTFSSRRVRLPYDNGFEIRTRRHLQVFMTIQ
jgi:hypothetical protein